MEADRAAVLTVRAAVLGVIDFRQARLLDRRWWRRSAILLDALDAEAQARARDAALALSLAQVGAGWITADGWKAAQDRALDMTQAQVAAATPWVKTGGDRVQAAAEDLAERFRRRIGDMRDPAFRAKMEAEAARMRAERVAAARESDDDRVGRRLRERDRRTRPGRRR